MNVCKTCVVTLYTGIQSTKQMFSRHGILSCTPSLYLRLVTPFFVAGKVHSLLLQHTQGKWSLLDPFLFQEKSATVLQTSARRPYQRKSLPALDGQDFCAR